MGPTDAPAAGLTLDPDAVRRLGHRAVDAIADRLAGLEAAPVGEPASRREMEAALSDGVAFVSTTRVAQRPVLRLCTINPRTTREDVERTIDRLAALPLAAHTR